MSRIFLSHASAETIQALALKKWLIDQNPPLANDIFLDVDDIKPTDEWAQVIQERGENCRVMVCLVSQAWEDSWECRQELKIARRFNKSILPARLEESVGQTVENYQWVDLHGEGRQTEIEVEYQDKEHVVSFPTRALRQLRDAVVGHGIGADTFVWPPPSDPKRVPYRGWAALDEFDAAVFFGRDAQIARALSAMHKMRESDEEDTLFVILGPSGAGKSSFLRAGLLPRLRRDDANYVVLDIVRPEGNVLTGPNGFAKAIYSARETYGLPPIALGDVGNACLEHADEVGRLLRQIHEAATARLDELPENAIKPSLVIPLDQAEELFGVDAGHEAVRFLDLIGEYAKADFAEEVPLIVVLTIRTDHHGKLQNAPQLSAVNSVLFDDLKPLPQASFKEVIEGPARRATEGGRPLELEHALVERLLIDGTQGADTLPLLSLTLAQLHEKYGEDGLLELAEYQRMGEMRNVVQTEIEALLSSDGTERLRQLDMLHAAFVPGLATINPDNDLPMRRVAQWDKVKADVKPLLERFIDKRLLVKDSRDGGDVIEVALESLLIHWTDLKGWLDAQRGDLKRAELLNREAAAWQKNERNTAYLLEGRRLEDAEKLFKQADYEPHIASAREFVTASRARVRRRRVFWQGAAAIIVVAALVAGLFGIRAIQSSRQADAWRLLNEAAQMLQGSRAGGDVRALQELLAARSIGKDAAGAVEAVAEGTRNQVKIIQNPPRSDKTPDGRPLDGTAPVRSVAISPDGTRIAWANDDRLVRVWDQQTNDIRDLDTYGDFGSKAVAFSPDGKLLAAGSGDSRLLLWDAKNLTPVGNPIQLSQGVLSIGFSGDGKSMATGASDGTVQVLDGAGHVRFREPPRHEPGTLATSVALSSDGHLLLSGGSDATVRLWDARSGHQLQLAGDAEVDNPVTAVAFSRKDELVAVGRSDGMMELRDGRTLAFIRRVKAHPNDIESLAFGPNDSRIVTGGGDNTVRVWDVDTFTPVGNPLLGHHGQVSSVRFSNDGTRIVSGGFDGSVRVWNALTAVPILAKQGKEVRAAAFSPDGKRFASGGTDGTVKLWDAETGKLINTIQLTGAECAKDYKCSVNSLAFDPKRPRLVTGASDGTVRVWDLTDPRQRPPLTIETPPEVPKDASKMVKSVAFSPDGGMIASAGLDGVVRVWNAADLKPVAAELAHATSQKGVDVRYQVWSLAFSPDSHRLAIGSGKDENDTDSNFLQLWTIDPKRDDPLMRDGDPIVDHQGWDIFCVNFDREGRRVVTSSYDGTVRVFDTQSHQRMAVLSSDQNPILSVAFAHDHDHDWLVAGGTDGKVRLWDMKTYEPIGTPLVGHGSWVYAVAFSPDDEVILSTSKDGTLRLWSTPTEFTTSVCDKLVANMSETQWNEWVSAGDWPMGYRKLCDLPIPN